MALFNAYQICIKCGVSACMDCDMNSDACDNDTEKGHLIQPCVVHSSASGKIYFQFFARFTNTKRKFHTFYNKYLNFIYFQMLKQPSFEKNAIVNKKIIILKNYLLLYFYRSILKLYMSIRPIWIFALSQGHQMADVRIVASRKLSRVLIFTLPSRPYNVESICHLYCYSVRLKRWPGGQWLPQTASGHRDFQNWWPKWPPVNSGQYDFWYMWNVFNHVIKLRTNVSWVAWRYSSFVNCESFPSWNWRNLNSKLKFEKSFDFSVQIIEKGEGRCRGLVFDN